MKTKKYVARLIEINNYFPQFPPVTQGGAKPTKLPDEDISDLLEFGLPPTWQKQMALMDFDPVEHPIQDFVEFCERMEEWEIINSHKHKTGKEKPKNSGEQKPSVLKKPKEAKVCLLHGKGLHSTDQCRTLIWQADRMKKQQEAQTPQGRKKVQEEVNLQETIKQSLREMAKEHAKKRMKLQQAQEEHHYLDTIGKAFNPITLDDDSTASSSMFNDDE